MPESSADLAMPPLSRPYGRYPPSASPWTMPRADWRLIAAIFAGGALGTAARAALAEAFPHPATAWPWPTFAVNIAAGYAAIHLATAMVRRVRVRR